MKAELILRIRKDFDDGALLELVIWRVPTPVEGCNHPYKYRLFYGRPGKRLIGYDNERRKGDHHHLDGVEKPYRFTTVEAMVSAFLAEVIRRRAK